MSETLLTIFQTVVLQSCKAGLVICAIFLFHAFLGKRLSPATRYLLWLLVPFALVFCVPVQSPLSVYNLLPDRETNMQQTEKPEIAVVISRESTEFAMPFVTKSVTEVKPQITVQNEPAPLRKTSGWSEADLFSMKSLAVIWLAGCCVMTLVFLRQGLVCRRWIRRGKQVTDQKVLTIFEHCVKQMNVKTWLVVAESPNVSGPFLIGAVRPTLLLPESMARNATEKQLRTVFLHELAHLKRWDVWVAWLTTLLLIVHWFNPLLWPALRRLNDAREEACDVLALEKLDQTERKNYGLSLVDITAQFQSPKRMPGLVGISENGRFLTRRIEMIRQIGTWKLRWGVIAALFALVVGVAAITDAQQPSKPGNIVVNGVEYAPVEKETVKPTQIQVTEETNVNDGVTVSTISIERALANEWKQPDLDDDVARNMLTNLLQHFPGEYTGYEGDDLVGIVIGQPEGSNFPITVFEGGLPGEHFNPGLRYNPKDDDKYVGTCNVNFNTISGLAWSMIKINQKFDGQKEERVENVLRELKATLIPGTVKNPENIAIIIPKNKEWDTIQVKKVAKTVPDVNDEKDTPQHLPGKYLGREGDDRIGMIIGEPKNGVYPITIYEDGLPGRGFQEHDDDYYTGTATLVADSGQLEITLDKKFDEGREERVESALKKLIATVIHTLKETRTENSVGRQTNLTLEIPANREWDTVRVDKLPE